MKGRVFAGFQGALNFRQEFENLSDGPEDLETTERLWQKLFGRLGEENVVVEPEQDVFRNNESLKSSKRCQA